ncbi:MAG: hypothetical protein VKL39_20645 [Leptolyngbyaceae bacterium]|nr:hypothetical protein [Leptolyngbyaceae bacterium]
MEELKINNETAQLGIGAVISRFCYKMAQKHNIAAEDILIGIEEIHPRRNDGKVKFQVMNLELQTLDEWIVENGL